MFKCGASERERDGNTSRHDACTSSNFSLLSSIGDSSSRVKTFTCWHASRNLRSANLPVLLCGWLPWLCALLRPSWAALEPFETDCWAWWRRTASGCRRALVVLLVWLAPSGCTLCAPRRPVNCAIKSRAPEPCTLLTFLLDLFPSFPFTSPLSSNSLDRWLSSVSHDEYWLLVSIASDGDGIVLSFLYHFRLGDFQFFKFISDSLCFFLSHGNSQPNHGSTFVEFMTARNVIQICKKQKEFFCVINF